MLPPNIIDYLNQTAYAKDLASPPLTLNQTFGEMNRTALMIAAENGAVEILDILLKSNAAMNIQDKEGNTAVMLALKNGYPECVELLVKYGAKLDVEYEWRSRGYLKNSLALGKFATGRNRKLEHRYVERAFDLSEASDDMQTYLKSFTYVHDAGWRGHSVGLAYNEHFLIYTNTGGRAFEQNRLPSGTFIFPLPKQSFEDLETLKNQYTKGTSGLENHFNCRFEGGKEIFIKRLADMLRLQPTQQSLLDNSLYIPLKPQKVGNCVKSNFTKQHKAFVFLWLATQAYKQQNGQSNPLPPTIEFLQHYVDNHPGLKQTNALYKKHFSHPVRKKAMETLCDVLTSKEFKDLNEVDRKMYAEYCYEFFKGRIMSASNTTPEKMKLDLELLHMLTDAIKKVEDDTFKKHLGGISDHLGEPTKWPEMLQGFQTFLYASDAPEPKKWQEMLALENKRGRTTLQRAIALNNVDNREWTTLQRAIALNNNEIVLKLWKIRGTEHTSMKEKLALLNWALKKKENKIARALLEFIDVNAPFELSEGYYETPLMAAVSGENHKWIAELITCGAVVSGLKKENGLEPISSPLNAAVETNNIESVNLLLSKGANIDEQTGKKNRTALMLAAENGHLECVELLVANRAAFDAEDKWGKTALMLAAENGHTDCVKVLVEKGAALDAEDNFGNTALISAAKNGHLECVELLVANRAALNAQDYEGQTALMLAAENEHKDIVKLLQQPSKKMKRT